jgi:glucose/arabinose dehydrogenase
VRAPAPAAGRRRRARATIAGLLAAALLAAACGDDERDDAGTTTTEPAEAPEEPGDTEPAPPEDEGEPAPELAGIGLALEEVASVDQPTGLVVRPGSRDLFVAEQRGTVRRIEVTEEGDGGRLRHQLQSTPLLDISDQTVDDGREQGLLGIAFSSDGRTMYLHHSAQPDGRTRLVSYQLGDGNSVDQGSETELLTVEQPFANHNGGHLALGPDGYLYMALGDGGSGGDPQGHGQNTSTLLGSILRIDPEGTLFDLPYGIPLDNPFIEGDGAPEIWAYGLRNPWRFSFDAETGDLWIADVGQDDWEEVNRLPAENGLGAGRGANLGWAEMEGTHPFQGGENPPGAVLPVHEYANPDDGCSVSGGYVYRGEAIGDLVGAYVFGDFCEPGIRAIRVEGDEVVDEHRWDLPIGFVTGFSQGAERELYVMSLGGQVARLVPGFPPE